METRRTIEDRRRSSQAREWAVNLAKYSANAARIGGYNRNSSDNAAARGDEAAAALYDRLAEVHEAVSEWYGIGAEVADEIAGLGGDWDG